MNKKLLETRVKSIEHYSQLIDDLKQTLSVTESTKNEILQSLVEFVPLKKGDVLIVGDRVFKFLRFDIVTDRFEIKCIVNPPHHSGGYSSYGEMVWLNILEPNYKIIYEAPAQ